MYLELATKEQLDAIYAKWNTNEKTLQEGAKYLIEWMNKQPHLPNVTGMKIARLRKQSSLPF